MEVNRTDVINKELLKLMNTYHHRQKITKLDQINYEMQYFVKRSIGRLGERKRS